MKIKNHRLYLDDNTQVPYKPSPNRGGKIDPRFLVMHFTAGRNFESSLAWLTNPLAKASAHIIIGRDGKITQMVPFNVKAWHAGQSSWLNLTGMNNHSIGIELDNAGKLQRFGGDWLAWFGEVYQNNEVLEATHKFEDDPAGWHTFPSIQIETAVKVAATIVNHYELEDIIGHDDVAPYRKVDPGPAFPLASFRSKVMGRAEDLEMAFEVTASFLNIRIGPDSEFEKLDFGPLPKGTIVRVLSSFEAWKFVEVEDVVEGTCDGRGWVHGKFLSKVDD